MFGIKGIVYVFDVDGVLVDASDRLTVALRRIGVRGVATLKELPSRLRSKFWRLFLSEELLVLDKPRAIGVELLKDRVRKGMVMILTGRPERLRKATLRELEEFGVPINRVRLAMRPNRDKRGGVFFKIDILKTLPAVAEVHDDEIRVLEEARHIHPRAKLYLHLRQTYVVLNP